METFAAARKRLHQELGARGWIISPPSLKVLWAKEPGSARMGTKLQLAAYSKEKQGKTHGIH